MPDELRHSQQHATMSSLKATHVAHRFATHIHSTPTRQLAKVKIPRQREMPADESSEFIKKDFVLWHDVPDDTPFKGPMQWFLLIFTFSLCMMAALAIASIRLRP